MTLNQMKYFLTLAECLSYTEAAKCLFITQPALSRQISAMEEELGVPLIVRDKKKIKLTPGGSVLYNRWSGILADFNQSVQEAKHANRGFDGELRLGILNIYDINGPMTNTIRSFRERFPGIGLSMERHSMEELPKLLQESKLDIILTYNFSLFEQPGLLTTDIQNFDSYLMMPVDHPMAEKEKVTLAEFKEDRFIQLANYVFPEGHRYITSLFAKSGIRPELMEAHKMEDIMLWVQSGDCVSISTNRTIEKHNPLVVLRPIDMEETKGHFITLAWGKNNYNPAIAAFLELAEHYFTEYEE